MGREERSFGTIRVAVRADREEMLGSKGEVDRLGPSIDEWDNLCRRSGDLRVFRRTDG